MDKDDIRQLIANGRLPEALAALQSQLPAALQNEVIQLQSQLSDLETKERLSLLDFSEVNTRRANITYAALQLLSKESPIAPAASSGGITQTHHGSGDNVAGDKMGRQINIGQGNYIENKPIDSKAKASAKRILFAAANPTNQARIQTDVELRTIKEEMQKGEKRDDFMFLPSQLAVRITELMRSFKDKPTIVHFSGHGETEGIIISTNDNEGLLLSDQTLKRLFKPLKGKTELVLLNSCYSAKQATLISSFGIVVIGHNLEVEDTAALSFAKGFYLGLSEGSSYETAYNDGIIAVLAENEQAAGAIEVWKDGGKLDW